ncbi:aminotransferase DegT [Sulfuricella sp. T08]|uniref:DegT/DnrJ/EryC1/StrS family aminotransferase n=1 Tax=Sulfuricella sp. T08 TaxID=1632857 RepID=UPI0006179A4A|nr:DegT/DnrJ/EryC1/StrS family aminotransferase [Sulfuricella sp. T08]GAO37793.1 aminotransferase DegT [Sulfuricella sp. T08]
MSPSWIPLSDPDISHVELDAVNTVLQSPRLSQGPVVEAFESAFADYIGRKYAVAVSSGSMGLLLCLRAHGIGSGDEVIASTFSWHQIAHAIALAGAKPVFADIDYWAGTLSPEKTEAKITPNTRAILASNTNGHPAPWQAFREMADRHGLKLLEDSTEAIGSSYQGKLVGSFGDCAVFDFSQPGPLVCGEGGMVVTDDLELVRTLRSYRNRRLDERFSVVIGGRLPYQACMSDVSAALGLAQLDRIDAILQRRKQVEIDYLEHIRSFEGIKPPYVAPDVTDIHWMLYLVHLGTRFSRSSRDAIIADLHTEQIEAVAYCQPLHLQAFYQELGYRKGNYFVTEKVADHALALPFHGHLNEDQIGFIVKTTKDASLNVGAGAAIY